MNKINEFKDNLIYETQKAFYDERGRGARYRMMNVGVDFFKKEIKDLKDLPGVVKWLESNGYADKIEMSDDGMSVTLKISGCCLKNIVDVYRGRGKEPFNCALANVIMHSMELNGSMPPELLPIGFEGDACKVQMAKIFTSSVVE